MACGLPLSNQGYAQCVTCCSNLELDENMFFIVSLLTIYENGGSMPRTWVRYDMLHELQTLYDLPKVTLII